MNLSMYNDFEWRAKGNEERCEYNSQTVANYARKFPRGHWSFLGPGSEKKWYGTYTDKPNGSWDKIAENMMTNFSDSGHPIFRASSPFERGELRSKEHGKKSLHFNGCDENIEWLLRTVISANPLSVDGAAADFCNELPKDLRAPGKTAAPDQVETMETPTGPCTAENPTNAQQRRNLVQEDERKFEQLSEDQKLFKLCSDAGLKLVDSGQYFYTVDSEEGQQKQHLCREYTMLRNEKKTRVRGWIHKNTRIGPVLNIKVCCRDDGCSIDIFRFHLCFKTIPLLGLES